MKKQTRRLGQEDLKRRPERWGRRCQEAFENQREINLTGGLVKGFRTAESAVSRTDCHQEKNSRGAGRPGGRSDTNQQGRVISKKKRLG